MNSLQISANISAEIRELLERYVAAHGVKKSHLIETAVLHHLSALDSIPADRTGCVAVVVDAYPAAVEFYQRYGFEAFEIISGKVGDRPAPLPTILPLGSIPMEYRTKTP